MSLRINPRDRCERCKMKKYLCLCPLLPSLRTRTRVEILLHPKESVRTSNTGNLLHLCLQNSSLALCDRRQAEPWSPSFYPESLPFLFYPSDDAQVLNQDFIHTLKPNQSIHLIVLDGAWKQAGRMLRHIDTFKEIPKLKLPASLPADSAPSHYLLRRASDLSGRLSTLESVAKALALLEGSTEGATIENELLRIQKLMVSRTLLARGRLALDQAERECQLPSVKIHELIAQSQK